MDWVNTNPPFARSKSKVPHGRSSLSLVPLCHVRNGCSKGGQELVVKEAVHETELLEKWAAGTTIGSVGVCDLWPMAPTLGYSIVLLPCRICYGDPFFLSEIWNSVPFHFGCCSWNLHLSLRRGSKSCHLSCGICPSFSWWFLPSVDFLWISVDPVASPATLKLIPQKKIQKVSFPTVIGGLGWKVPHWSTLYIETSLDHSKPKTLLPIP